MKKLLESVAIFAIFCSLPFIGAWLTKLGYPEFNTTNDFAWGVGCCVFLGFIFSVIYYFEEPNDNK